MSHTTVIAVPVTIVRSDPSFIPTAIRDMRIATNWTGLCPGPPPLREALRRAAVALAEAGRLGRPRGPRAPLPPPLKLRRGSPKRLRREGGRAGGAPKYRPKRRAAAVRRTRRRARGRRADCPGRARPRSIECRPASPTNEERRCASVPDDRH